MTEKKEKLTLHQKIFMVQQNVACDLEESAGNKLQWKPIVHWKVTGAVKAALAKYRLTCIPIVRDTRQDGQRTICSVSLVITDIDTGEQTSVGEYVGYGIDSMDKGPGKAVSYAIKTAMLKTFMMNIADENEIDLTQSPAQYLLEALQNERVGKLSPRDQRFAWLDKHRIYIEQFRIDLAKTKKSSWTEEQKTLCDILAAIKNPDDGEPNEES